MERTENEPGQLPGHKQPAVRTMQSDIAEYMKTEKPSLVSIVARDVRAHPPPFSLGSPQQRRIVFWLGAGAATLAVLGYAGYFAWIWFAARTPLELPAETPPPPGFIAFDRTIEASIAISRPSFESALRKAAASASEPVGAVTRLVLRVPRDGSGERHLAAADLIALLGAESIRGLPENMNGLPQFLLYQDPLGPRSGVILPVRDPARAIQSFLVWEPAMTKELEPLLLGEVSQIGMQFRDAAYRNLDYRFASLSSEDDLGIGYLYFPAKGLMVIATSEPTLRVIVDRLFERR